MNYLTDTEVIESDFDSFFGDRKVIFVKYPADWTARQMVEQINWAKTYAVSEMSYD